MGRRRARLRLRYDQVASGYRNGAPIRIGDIGRAVDGRQNDELSAWTNGKHTALLLIFKQANASVIKTADGALAEFPRLEASIPCPARQRGYRDSERAGRDERTAERAGLISGDRTGLPELVKHRAFERSGGHAQTAARDR